MAVRSRTVGSALSVRPMSGHIGAEIDGVDLGQPLSPELVAEIRATLLRWKVVFFRDQHITRQQHVELGRLFGSVTPAHPTLPPAYPPTTPRSCYSTTCGPAAVAAIAPNPDGSPT